MKNGKSMELNLDTKIQSENMSAKSTSVALSCGSIPTQEGDEYNKDNKDQIPVNCNKTVKMHVSC